MKKYSLYIIFTFLMSLPVQASDLVYMTAAPVKSVQVNSKTDSSIFILRTEGSWVPYPTYADKAASCPTPVYATIDESKPGSAELFALALESKKSQLPITVIGRCGYHEAYFEIERIIF
ncbi:hypothetical protein KO527_20025 [Pseudoalteromonas sp. C2R02]|uniref:hypothetical protein n=1 Tax=Pseudoalteromonas sp. C2R02 TaxID=2841565 RepID=UPI001C0A1193|nr:hypothetical protein [Pseudoalteromonas sp. C2R02]MBU2971640.1 hypothetical protein [Pseudoalteromonas sp. C2R02]